MLAILPIMAAIIEQIRWFKRYYLPFFSLLQTLLVTSYAFGDCENDNFEIVITDRGTIVSELPNDPIRNEIGKLYQELFKIADNPHLEDYARLRTEKEFEIANLVSRRLTERGFPNAIFGTVELSLKMLEQRPEILKMQQ